MKHSDSFDQEKKGRKHNDSLLTHTLHLEVWENLSCCMSLETISLDKRN